MSSDKKDPGRISLLMRVLPEDVGTDLKQIEAGIGKALPADCKLEGTDVKPFAFGLKALVCQITVPDVEGNADMIEEMLRGVPGVQGVEFLKMGRIIG
jgi:translation elongation factor aEF-1 beta